jgi:predicted nucleotidyltransferase
VLAPSVARVNAVLQLANERPLRAYSISRRLQERFHTKTVSAIRTLVRLGIVRSVDRQGHAEYEPNPESPYADVARRLAFIDLGIRGLLPADARVAAIFVHGSLVDGRGGPSSDLDVLIIGKLELRDARAAMAPLETMLGRPVDVSVRTSAEVRDGVDAGDAFIADALGGMLVWGSWA